MGIIRKELTSEETRINYAVLIICAIGTIMFQKNDFVATPEEIHNYIIHRIERKDVIIGYGLTFTATHIQQQYNN